ncbi:alpha/beta fold hydrolase [Bacillus sp. AK031]
MYWNNLLQREDETMECNVKYGTIHYKVCGEGKPIVILHSMGTDHRAMSAWIEPLFTENSNFKRIYVDLPAHGCSKINDQFKGTEDIVKSAQELIEKVIGEERFSLVGMSYGGYVAQGILDTIKEKVEGICLLVPAVHNRTGKLPEKISLVEEENLTLQLQEDIKSAYKTLMVIQNKTTLERFLSEVQPGRELANRDFLTSNWRESDYFLTKEPFSECVELNVPALFILGKQDSICGYEDQFQLFQKFSNATFTVVDGAGHMVPIEKREVVQHLLNDWLSRVSDAR